jgi:ABC-type amino acid transport substrate-binding protein
MTLDRSQLLCAIAVAAIIFAGTPARAQQPAGTTIDRIRAASVLRVAYREDAAPFSYKDKLGEPAGYMIDLCKAVALKLKDQLGLAQLRVDYVPVTVVNRFDTIQQGRADLLCDSTSETLARRQLVDFSISTYVDGAGLMIRNDGPKDMRSMAGRKIAVVGGTTTEQVVRDYVKSAGISAEVVSVASYSDGLSLLENGQASAYIADRSILESLVQQSKAPANLLIATDYLTIEPYALALLHGDESFRLAVDTALSHIYRANEIDAIYDHTFADRARTSPIMQTLYLISGLPD